MYKLFDERQERVFKIRRYGRKPRPKSPKVGIEFNTDAELERNLPTVIQGKQVDSKEEARAAVALDMLGIGYEYQKSILGGKRVRGGTVVDFWLYTSPNPTPMYLTNKYWHNIRKQFEDMLLVYKMRDMYKGQINDVLLVDDKDMSSVKKAYYRLKELLL